VRRPLRGRHFWWGEAPERPKKIRSETDILPTHNATNPNRVREPRPTNHQALITKRFPDPLQARGMFSIRDRRCKSKLSRWFRQFHPRTATSKGFLKRQAPHWRDAEYPDHGKVETFGVIIGESFLQHLRLQNVKIGKWLQQAQIFNPTRELNVDIGRKAHNVGLRFNRWDINPKAISLFMKKGGKNKETFVLKSEPLTSFSDSSFSEDEAGLTAKH